MTAVQRALRHHLEAAVGQVFTAAVGLIQREGKVVFLHAAGRVNPEAGEEKATPETLFDLASLTKLFTATAVLRLLAAHGLSLDAPLGEVLPAFCGPRPLAPYPDPLQSGKMITLAPQGGEVEADAATFRRLLAHNAGLPAWLPLFRMPAEERRRAVMETAFAYPPGQHVVYSDLDFILLGWAAEALSGQPLAKALRAWVSEPLGLLRVHFRPAAPPAAPLWGIAATERCRWRGRRLWGEVHDENAWALGGVAGHAGLFAAAADVAALGQAWLDALRGQGLLATLGKWARTAVQPQAEKGGLRRGLGWALRSSSPEDIAAPLSPTAFGHTGFTGTSLYVDPARRLVAVALTNRVYFGREPEPIRRWRQQWHALATRL